MKKLFCVIVFLPLIFSSCKEEEEVILSNDIIVGDWIIYHKEIFDSDNNLSFAETNSYDLETISLSVKSDYTWTAPLNSAQPSNPWGGYNAGGSWELSYNYYYFDLDITSGWTHSFYCNNNIVVLQIGGGLGSNQNKQLYYFQRTGYDFSNCDEISYNENP